MAGHPKVDLKKELKAYFSAPSGEFEEFTIAPAHFLMIDGQGSPGGSDEYRAALETLYPAAYGIKFFSKDELGRDYVVPPLEGLWWSDSLDAYTEGRRDEWRWTLMLMLPGWIGRGVAAEAIAAVARRKPAIDFAPLRTEEFAEGLSLQKLNLGSFADEAPVLHHLHHELMPARGYGFNGRHHEIYLTDPRKTRPERLRTILRQPVVRV